jgi:hypothetical protein
MQENFGAIESFEETARGVRMNGTALSRNSALKVA